MHRLLIACVAAIAYIMLPRILALSLITFLLFDAYCHRLLPMASSLVPITYCLRPLAHCLHVAPQSPNLQSPDCKGHSWCYPSSASQLAATGPSSPGLGPQDPGPGPDDVIPTSRMTSFQHPDLPNTPTNSLGRSM